MSFGEIRLTTNQVKGRLCPVECMVFNETALIITSLLKPEVNNKKQCMLGLDEKDMSELHIGDYRKNVVICKEGFSLT